MIKEIKYTIDEAVGNDEVAKILIDKAWEKLHYKERVKLVMENYDARIRYQRNVDGSVYINVEFESWGESKSQEMARIESEVW